MTLRETLFNIIIPLVAGAIGSLLTVWYQKKVVKRTDKYLTLLTLMGFRHLSFSNIEFVKALNMVDLVFHDNRTVRDHLHTLLNLQRSETVTTIQRINEFFNLLSAMATDLGYDDLSSDDLADFFVFLGGDEDPTRNV